jgi:hypothetical protein
VPFPVVFFYVGQSRSHSTLSRAGVRTGWEKLRDNSSFGVWSGFDSGAHSCASGTNNHNVVLVVVNLRGAQLVFL